MVGKPRAHPTTRGYAKYTASGMRKLSTSGGLTASTRVAIAASVAFSARVTGGRPRRRDHYPAQRSGSAWASSLLSQRTLFFESSSCPRRGGAFTTGASAAAGTLSEGEVFSAVDVLMATSGVHTAC